MAPVAVAPVAAALRGAVLHGAALRGAQLPASQPLMRTSCSPSAAGGFCKSLCDRGLCATGCAMAQVSVSLGNSVRSS